MNELIVGGGPIGSYLATQLKEPTLIDQKEHQGKPVRCTGILTSDILKFIKPKDLKKSTLNTITHTTIHGPTQKTTLNINKNFIICNETFDRIQLEKAEDNGAKIHFKHKYLSSTSNKHEIRDLKSTKKKIIKTNTLIGCDGPQSHINKTFQIQRKKKSYLGYQIRLKVKEQDNNIHFFPHIGAYAWYVPESPTIARVGVCAPNNPKQILEAFSKRFQGRQLEIQGGFIPYHQPLLNNSTKINKLNIHLFGDSTGHIKNTTGGGIIPGIKAAKHYTQNTKDYKGTNGKTQRELYMHFLVHNVLKQCNEKEWDLIIQSVEKHNEAFQNINRDQLWKLFPKLLTNKTFLKIGIKKGLNHKILI
jgi:digeranylgeranylglycerophospholipid reductase